MFEPYHVIPIYITVTCGNPFQIPSNICFMIWPVISLPETGYPAIHFLFRQTHDTKINWNIINRQTIAVPIFGDEHFPTKSKKWQVRSLLSSWIIYSESPNLLSSLAMGIHGYPKSCQRPTPKSENCSPIIDVFFQDIIPFKVMPPQLQVVY